MIKDTYSTLCHQSKFWSVKEEQIVVNYMRNRRKVSISDLTLALRRMLPSLRSFESIRHKVVRIRRNVFHNFQKSMVG